LHTVKTMPIEDLPAADLDDPGGSIDTTPFIGSWLSTNTGTQGIAKLVVRGDHRGLHVRGFGACVPSLCEWGEAKADVFAESAGSNAGLAFRAVFDFGFKETVLQAKVKKGVLVVANFNRFKDGSRRASYFSREFFYRTAESSEGPARSGGTR
jgi:hypothetical protein